MRILHLIPSMGNGGAERQLSYLALALADRGHDVHVVVLRGGPNERRLLGGRVHVHRLPAYGHHDPRLALAIVRIARHVRPDVIQTWLVQMDVLGGLVAIRARIPWVLSERCDRDCYPRSVKSVARRLLARYARLVVANSHGGIDYWRDLARSSQRAVVMNGLPLDELDTVARFPSKSLPGPDVPMILYVGRLAPQKNVKTLVRAFARVRQSAKLVIVGDGPERLEIGALIEDLGLSERVFAVGEHLHIWAMMKNAAATVSISHFEGQPNVLLEAMACHCPIIASDIPSHREILDGDTAVIVERTDLDAISAAIDDLLSDPRAATARALMARKVIEERTFEKCAAEYEELYEGIRRGASSGNSDAPGAAQSNWHRASGPTLGRTTPTNVRE